MTDAPALLPCPFCGGAAEIVDAVEAGNQAKVVCCKKCMCSSRVVFALMDDVTFDLVSAWNARADLARPMTVAEAAKRILDAMDGTDADELAAVMKAADAMTVDMHKALGPIPMLGSGLRALSEGGE